MKYLRGHLALLLAAACVFTAGDSLAFKSTTHVATANAVRDELASSITPGSAPDTLLFHAGGMTIELKVSAKRAYRAVVNYPEHFRAGAIGPDGFPDVLTGQMMMHGAQSESVGKAAAKVAGRQWEPIALSRHFESRLRPSNYRSIDFAMGMLKYWSDNESSASWGPEPALAFVMGYFLHAVGDGFSHTWVNSYTGSAWDFADGEGIFGVLTEELQHVSVESLVDVLVPSYLLSTKTDKGQAYELDRMTTRIPLGFLDSFYSSVTPGLLQPGANLSLHEFVKTFQDVDKFYGGPIFSYLNAQFYVSTAIKKWAGLGKLLDVAEQIASLGPVKFLIRLNNVAEYPEMLQHLPQDPVTSMFAEFMSCGAYDGSSMADIIPESELLNVLEYLGDMNKRLATYTEKARVVRRNWLLLNACTAENLAKMIGPDYDHAQPGINTDACADIVRKGWHDQSPGGLYRGSLRPSNHTPSTNKFLVSLKTAFLGGRRDLLYRNMTTAEAVAGNAPFAHSVTLEYSNGHRKLGKNIERLYSYLKSDGFVFAEVEHVLFPQEDQPLLDINKWDKMCGTARSSFFENCMNVQLGVLASVARQTRCEFETALCMPGCIRDKCHDWTYTKFGYGLCISGVNAVYATAALTQCTAECTVSSIECNIDNFTETFQANHYATDILEPVRDVCDAVDEAREFIDCIGGVNTSFDEQVSCVVELCEESASAVGANANDCSGIYDLIAVYDEVKDVLDVLDDISPYYLVNLTFLEEDLAQSSPYATSMQDWIDDERTKLQTPPLPRDYPERLSVLDSYQTLHDFVQSPGSVPVSDVNDARLDIASNAARLGLVPTVYGPTVRRILLDVGTSFVNTFTPFFNAVQGGKLAPLSSQRDIEQLFTAHGVTTSALPWGSAERVGSSAARAGSDTSHAYSGICTRDQFANLYCDSIASFDDPNGLNFEDELLTPWPDQPSWVPGRGVYAWNEIGAKNDHTVFPLCTSDDANSKLYNNIFRVPFDSWQIGGGNPTHSGQFAYFGPRDPAIQMTHSLASMAPEATGEHYSAPSVAIGTDGSVYLATTYAVQAVGRDMSPKWEMSDWFGGFSTPPAMYGNKLYVGSADGRLVKLDAASGNVEWEFPNDVRWRTRRERREHEVVAFKGAPVVTNNGIIVVVGEQGRILAFSPEDPKPIWKYDLVDGCTAETRGSCHTIVATPSIDRDGTIYVGTANHHLGENFFALKSGARVADVDRVIWAKQLAGIVTTTPVVGPGRRPKIYVRTDTVDPSAPGRLYALSSRDGFERWTYEASAGDSAASITVSNDGQIYMGGADGYLRALDSSGRSLWSYYVGPYLSAELGLQSRTIVDGSGIIYVGMSNVGGAGDSTIYALRPGAKLSDGERELFQLSIDGTAGAPVAVDSKGTLYIVSEDQAFAGARTLWAVRDWLGGVDPWGQN